MTKEGPYKETPSRRFFTPKMARKYLGISPRLLNELTATGELPAYNRRGHREYRLEDLDKYGESHEKWIPGEKRPLPNGDE